MTPIHVSAHNGHSETVLSLVNECITNVNNDNESQFGTTPIHVTAYLGHTETVRSMVLECSNNAKTADNNGNTPVMFDAQNGHAETVRVLVQACSPDTTELPTMMDGLLSDDDVFYLFLQKQKIGAKLCIYL